MKKQKPCVHFIENYLINPTNPVTVNVIGAGGTGSQVMTALARINHSLVALQHAGLFVRLFDDDVVTEANLGRQLFTPAEAGFNKSVAIINRLNRFYGTNWKACTYRYSNSNLYRINDMVRANLTISCVDTAQARFEIAEILEYSDDWKSHHVDKPYYWMDFGNSQNTGQVLLSTISTIEQPKSKKFRTVERLPFMTEEFEQLLRQSEFDNTPSCSLAEALTKQDLFINSSLANLGASLLWQMFREGMISNRGFFLNLHDFRTQPVKVA